MKRLIAVLVFIQAWGGLAVGQQGAAQTPPPGTIIEQTPFGPRTVPAPPAAQQPPQPQAPPADPVPPPAAVAQPAPQPAVPPQQAADEAVPISLTLDNADIYQVIRIIADALDLNYVIDPAVQGTVNINTAGTLRRSDLLPILETILKINGATMIQTGNFFQIVPANTAVRQPLTVQERTTAIAPDDQMVMQILRMRYVVGAEMARLLTPYLSEGGNIVVHEGGNVLLVTERRSNLRKLLEIVDIFDTNAFEGERVRLFPIQNNIAQDLITDLTTVFAAYALSPNSTAIRFLAINRLNAILVVSSNETVFPEVERWITRLDQPVANAGVRNYVYKVKYARATDIQSILMQLYGTGLVQLSSIYNTPGNLPQQQPQATTPPPSAASPFSGAPAAPQAGVSATPGGMRVIADAVNNALVIQARPQDYVEVERTLQELDVLPRQVLIDAQIYEVVLDDSLAFGVSAMLQNRSAVERQTTASFATAGTGPPSLNVQTFAYIGDRARELLLFLNASENRSRVRTLSAPSVLISDNMTANFQVGAEVPIPTSSSVTPVQSDGTNLFAQTIVFRSTGVILQVKPQINDSGSVSLEIAQEVSQAGQNTTSAVVAPVIGKASVQSSVVVRDGQTVALAGFIRENQNQAQSRVPLLGRIPGLGALFGNTLRSTSRSELIVMITPHVLRTHEDADLATEELKSKLREVQQLLN